MPDQAGLQALLDPASDGTGIMITRWLTEPTGTVISIDCNGVVSSGGRAQSVDVLVADSNAQAQTKILNKLNGVT